MKTIPVATGKRRRAPARAVVLVGAVLLAQVPQNLFACSGDVMEVSGTDTHFPLVYGDRPSLGQLTELGRKMFFDAGLSRSGKQSCASCHDPARAYGPPNALAVQPGGVALDRFGFRTAPALRYLHAPVAFTEHFYENEPSGGREDQGPTGGRTWDGRVNRGHDQALMPLLDANEMANAGKQDLFERLRHAPYAAEFKAAVSAPGEDVLTDPDSAVLWMTIALATFEQTPAEFHPFSSKYDAYLRDEVLLSAQEQRGLALFTDIKKGNCASCHPSTGKNPARNFPVFTDFGYTALGVPRNRELAVNRDPAFFDMGLCGPLRTDLKERTEYCGMFRTPSLRNAALRQRFFHNGAVRTLRDAVSFYATRDTAPQKWYPKQADGQVAVFDDLPVAFRANVNREIPFRPLPGNRPRLSEAEVDAITAFLKTLTDGYRPQASPPARLHAGGKP